MKFLKTYEGLFSFLKKKKKKENIPVTTSYILGNELILPHSEEEIERKIINIKKDLELEIDDDPICDIKPLYIDVKSYKAKNEFDIRILLKETDKKYISFIFTIKHCTRGFPKFTPDNKHLCFFSCESVVVDEYEEFDPFNKIIDNSSTYYKNLKILINAFKSIQSVIGKYFDFPFHLDGNHIGIINAGGFNR